MDPVSKVCLATNPRIIQVMSQVTSDVRYVPHVSLMKVSWFPGVARPRHPAISPGKDDLKAISKIIAVKNTHQTSRDNIGYRY